MSTSGYKKKVIVFRKNVEEDKARSIIEEKKTSPFRHLLKKPDKDEVHIHSVNLVYESFLMISGRYVADFYRKAVHPIKVDYNVQEVVLGKGIFPIQTKSRWKKALNKKGKNKVDLELEEHVFLDNEMTMFFDHHGKEVEFPYKMDPKSFENYPSKILENENIQIRKPEINNDDAIDLLTEEFKKPVDSVVRGLNEDTTIKEITEIYIPVFEARLAGQKNKVEIMRLDAVRNKIL